MFGALSAGQLAERLGRRKTISLTSVRAVLHCHCCATDNSSPLGLPCRRWSALLGHIRIWDARLLHFCRLAQSVAGWTRADRWTDWCAIGCAANVRIRDSPKGDSWAARNFVSAGHCCRHPTCYDHRNSSGRHVERMGICSWHCCRPGNCIGWRHLEVPSKQSWFNIMNGGVPCLHSSKPSASRDTGISALASQAPRGASCNFIAAGASFILLAPIHCLETRQIAKFCHVAQPRESACLSDHRFRVAVDTPRL